MEDLSISFFWKTSHLIKPRSLLNGIIAGKTKPANGRSLLLRALLYLASNANKMRTLGGMENLQLIFKKIRLDKVEEPRSGTKNKLMRTKGFTARKEDSR